MPTLIRLLVALLFLAGLGYAALFALTIFVDPGEKEITHRIPARDLVVDGGGAPERPLAESLPRPETQSTEPAAQPTPPAAPAADAPPPAGAATDPLTDDNPEDDLPE